MLRDPCRQVSVWTEFLLTNLRDLSGWVSSEKVVTLFLPDINIVDFIEPDTKANCCNSDDHPNAAIRLVDYLLKSTKFHLNHKLAFSSDLQVELKGMSSVCAGGQVFVGRWISARLCA